MKWRLSISESIALFVVSCFVMVAILAPWIAPSDPEDMDLYNRMSSPLSKGHFLGTDHLGRDTVTRLMYGARVSLIVSVAAVGWAIIIGGSLGLIAAYVGKKTDILIMRIMDILLSLPPTVLAIFIVTVLGSGMFNLTVAIGIRNIPVIARLIRGDAITVQGMDYIVAANAIGASRKRIALMHILPNCINSIIISATLLTSTAILVEASLSFLGLGLPPGTASWGSMINEARPFIWTHPQNSIIPGIAITVLVLSLNVLGDFVRDVLDPRKMKRGKKV
jgi:peptide/nickel transport system permease protein